MEGNLNLPEVCHDVGVDGDGNYEVRDYANSNTCPETLVIVHYRNNL